MLFIAVCFHVQHSECNCNDMRSINKIALPALLHLSLYIIAGCCSVVGERKCILCVCVCPYFQLGKNLLDVTVAALCNVHVLFIRPTLEHRLGGVGEVLVEGEVCSHSAHLYLHALLRFDFAHVLFPAGYHL